MSLMIFWQRWNGLRKMSDRKPARYFRPTASGKIECLLCPTACKLAEGKTGICFGRRNIGGTLYAVNYGQTVSVAVDPIEKKPLYHFYPSSAILSTGPNGCNLRCQNCQNWNISQEQQPTRFIPPKALIQMALDAGSIGIAYTYTEPLIWWEYIYDTATLSREHGLKTVLVSNGQINEEPWRELVGLVDAINIDVKSMNADFYRTICKGSLEHTLRTAEIAAENNVAMEITNLVITNRNDSDADFQRLVDWIAAIDSRIPLHFSRYFPHHQMHEPATPTETLKRAYEIAKRKLSYVYLGNIDIEGTSDTHCPECDHLLVKRSHYRTVVDGIADGKCTNCGREVNIRL